VGNSNLGPEGEAGLVFPIKKLPTAAAMQDMKMGLKKQA